MSASLDNLIELVRKNCNKTNFLLKIEKDGDWREFIFDGRKIVHIDTSEVREKFSSLLMAENLISKEELFEAIKKAKGNSYEVDNIILSSREFSKLEIYKIFRKQMKYVVADILLWEDFSIKESTLKGGIKFVKYPIKVEDFYMTIFRKYIPSKKREEFLSLYDEDVEIKVKIPFNELKKVPLTKDESVLIGRVSNFSKLSDIKNFVEIPEEKIMNILLAFWCSDIIDLKKSSDVSFKITTPDTTENLDEVLRDKEDEELREKIESLKDFYEDLKSKNYFEVFDLTPEGFDMGKLKKRYLEMVRNYHPDKFAKFNSEELNNLLEDLSNYINTAYETLKDDDARHEYENNLAKYSAKSSSSEKEKETPGKVARESFERGRMLVNAKNYAEAVSYLKAAVRIKPDNAEYNAYLGYAMSKTSQFRREAEKYLLKAIELAPMQINYYIHLGRLYKEAKLYNKALRIFQEGLAWDNTNNIILKEINEINEILGNKKKKGFFGGLGKLFKK